MQILVSCKGFYAGDTLYKSYNSAIECIESEYQNCANLKVLLNGVILESDQSQKFWGNLRDSVVVFSGGEFDIRLAKADTIWDDYIVIHSELYSNEIKEKTILTLSFFYFNQEWVVNGGYVTQASTRVSLSDSTFDGDVDSSDCLVELKKEYEKIDSLKCMEVNYLVVDRGKSKVASIYPNSTYSDPVESNERLIYNYISIIFESLDTVTYNILGEYNDKYRLKDKSILKTWNCEDDDYDDIELAYDDISGGGQVILVVNRICVYELLFFPSNLIDDINSLMLLYWSKQ